MNPRYKKLDHESIFEYGLRLIEIKIEEKPEDLEWEDIIELTGMDCHRDTLRKAASVSPYSGYAVAQYYKRKTAEEGNPSSYGEDLDEKIRTFKREAKKFYDQRRELNNVLYLEGRAEHMLNQMAEAASALNEDYPLIVCKEASEMNEENEAVVVFSDWHYGMKADNVWGYYNTRVCEERVAKLVRMVKDRIQLHGCRRVHILILGDMAHGAIHTTARVAAEELVCDQIMHVAEIIAQAISQIADSTEETCVYSTYGNHLRTVQSKKENIHADNMEKLIPWWLEQRMQNRKDVQFPTCDIYEFISLDVFGYHIVAAHGDLDNVRNAGQMLNTVFTKKFGHTIDYIILGDKHHEEWFSEMGIRAMIAGCLCGSDEYANGKRLYSTPSQMMLVFNRENGCDAIYNLEFREDE